MGDRVDEDCSICDNFDYQILKCIDDCAYIQSGVNPYPYALHELPVKEYLTLTRVFNEIKVYETEKLKNPE